MRGNFLVKCWGVLGVRGGVWVEGGWRGNKGGGCESSVSKLANRLCIPIYTALAGCDAIQQAIGCDLLRISIHTALAGCDDFATKTLNYIDISIHTALAGCDCSYPYLGLLFIISIHTALAGCDGKSHQFFSLNLHSLISYSTRFPPQINHLLTTSSFFPPISGANVPGILCGLVVRTL